MKLFLTLTIVLSMNTIVNSQTKPQIIFVDKDLASRSYRGITNKELKQLLTEKTSGRRMVLVMNSKTINDLRSGKYSVREFNDLEDEIMFRLGVVGGLRPCTKVDLYNVLHGLDYIRVPQGDFCKQ